jgi:hypothetical protein
MARRQSLFRYYADPQWAEAFLDGRMRFWSLGYFRDLEEQGVRGDANEGRAHHRPEGGLQVTNRTQGTRFTMPAHRLSSAVKQEEILVFCASRSHSRRLWEAFGASVCIEILNIPAFCPQVQARLPAGATFPGRPGHERIGHRVEYYRVSDAADTRWALPDRIAISKLTDYAWQDEFRLVFSLTDALAFQNVALALAPTDAPPLPPAQDHPFHDAAAGSLRDLCRVHAAPPGAANEGGP